MTYIKTEPNTRQNEHDAEQTGTKKVLLYGWDYTNNVKRRIAVNESGELIIEGGTTPTGPSGDAYLMESGDYILMETGDYLLIE